MYDQLNPQEKIEYLDRLYDRLLEHRYRYYILSHPVIEDWLYDHVEKYYNELAASNNVRQMDMVDFDVKDPRAQAAALRVNSGKDYYSIWEAEMKPVWNKLGLPRYRE